MTHRKRLIFGLLVVAPMAAPSVAPAADNLFAPANRPTTIISSGDSTATAWKTSDQPTSVDIRFKKPEGLIVTDRPANSSGNVPASIAQAASTTNPASIAATTQKLPPIAAPVAAPPVTAAVAPAATPTANQTSNQVASSTQAQLEPDATPVAAAGATIAAPAVKASSEGRQIQDDQIKLVTRLLMDNGLTLAAEEETLPTSPASPIPSDLDRDGGNSTNNPYDAGCYENCCPPPPRLFWVGGVEATFLWPDLNSDGVSFAAEEIEDERWDAFSSQDNDVDSMYMAPRIWLGVQGCAWGANLRYWHLNASEGTHDPSIGGDGSWDAFDCGRPDFGFFSCNRLEAYTIDLELTRRFCIHDCWMQAAVGVRHASIENDEGVTGLALTDEGLLSGFAHANRMSRGTGLLFGLYGRKALYPCSCVHWFYNARISTLWGPTQTSAETFAAVQSNDPDFVAGAASVNGAYTCIDDTMFIGEIQLGLEWNYALACLPANAFFRTALEYQRWDGGKGFSAADSFAGIAIDDGFPVESVVSTSASAAEPQMDLFGFTIGTGLTW